MDDELREPLDGSRKFERRRHASTTSVRERNSEEKITYVTYDLACVTMERYGVGNVPVLTR